MAYSAPTTRATGFLVTAAVWNQDVVDNVAFLANPPFCRLTHNSTQSIANGAWTAMAFNTEAQDTDSMHSTVTNTSRITVATAGVYVFYGLVAFAAHATGFRGAGFRKNGVGTIPTDGADLKISVGVGASSYATVTAPTKMAVGDYMELLAFQNSGGALNAVVEAGLPMFSAAWVGLG